MLLFIYKKRKNVEIQKLLFPLFYFILYRTKLGIKFMNKVAKRYRKQLKYIGYVGIFIGFMGMILISYELLKNFFNIVFRPETVSQVGLVLPIEAKGVFYVPFFYWIISIFIIAVVHEFSHGMLAVAHNIKIKSSGFAFLGILIPIIPAAFVEPDEKKLQKSKISKQLSVFAAGPLSNIVLAFVILFVLGMVFSPVMDRIIEFDGIEIDGFIKGESIYPAESVGMMKGEIINAIDDTEITYMKNFTIILSSKKPQDEITITTDKNTYSVALAANPENKSQGYLGIYAKQHQRMKDNVKRFWFLPGLFIWVAGLFYWLFLLNLGIGLFNLVPLGPLDGGRMLHLLLIKNFKKQKGEKIWKIVSIAFLLIIVFIILNSFLS